MEPSRRVDVLRTGRSDTLAAHVGDDVLLYRRDGEPLRPKAIVGWTEYQEAVASGSDGEAGADAREGRRVSDEGRRAMAEPLPGDPIPAPRAAFELVIEGSLDELDWSAVEVVLEQLVRRLRECRELRLVLAEVPGRSALAHWVRRAGDWAAARRVEKALFWSIPVTGVAEYEALEPVLPDASSLRWRASPGDPGASEATRLCSRIVESGFSSDILLDVGSSSTAELGHVIRDLVDLDMNCRIVLCIESDSSVAWLPELADALGPLLASVDPFATALLDASMPSGVARVAARWSRGMRLGHAGELTLDDGSVVPPSLQARPRRTAGGQWGGSSPEAFGLDCEGCALRAFCDGHADTFPGRWFREQYGPSVVCAARTTAAELVVEYALDLYAQSRHGVRAVARYENGVLSVEEELR